MIEAFSNAIDRLVEHSGLTQLDPVEMAVQIVATILLIVVVKIFFWEKVTAFLDKRREVVDSELTEATEQNEEAKQLKNEAEQALESAKKEAQSIVDEAKTRGEDTRREIVREANEEAERIKDNAQKDMERELELARNKMRDEMIEIATHLTQKVIEKKLPKATYNQLIDEAIKEVRKQ